MFAVLRLRDYRYLWLGQTISLLGDQLRSFALVLWVFEASGHSPAAQSAAFIAGILPTMVLGPISGVLVDRWDRRKVMLASDLIRGFLSLALLAAVLAGQAWTAIGLSFLGSCVAVFFDPARSALIPRVVGQEGLVQAISLGQTTSSVMSLAGPALATAVYLQMGPTPAFIADSASFFISTLCIALVRTSGVVEAVRSRKPAFWPEFQAGIRYCWNQQFIRSLMVGLTITMMGLGAVNTLFLFVFKELNIPITAMGYVAMMEAAATLAVSLGVGAAAQKLVRAPLMVPAGLGTVTLGILLIGLSRGLIHLLVAIALAGIGMGLANIGIGVVLTSLVPDELRGRVFGTVNPVPMAMMLLSSALGAVAVRYLPAQMVFVYMAPIAAVATLYLYISYRNLTVPGSEAKATDEAAG